MSKDVILLANKFNKKLQKLGFSLEGNAPDSLIGTIMRASTNPQFGIPNFKKIIEDYNAQTQSKAGSVAALALVISLISENNVKIESVQLFPTNELKGGISKENLERNFQPMIAGIQAGVPKYFANNPETLNREKPGLYKSILRFLEY